ncbi:MAG: hypothetical protein H0U76_11660 [Ktedonobacteraceae bacterium]|nr:hypothetical protein [Ktedonobacteraceae bacterium]MBA3826307.1 hypothetical protein [Ktedonobacterales bacterium]
MNDTLGKMVLHHIEQTPVTNPQTGELTEGEQLVITLKASGDEKEYQFQFPMSEEAMKRLPPDAQLTEWRNKGQMVIISSSTMRANPFEHKAKGEDGKPIKYPQPGKVFPVGNKTIEIGTVLSFSAYAIREATDADRTRAEEANGMYNERRNEARQRGIVAKQDKAKKRTADAIAKAKQKK